MDGASKPRATELLDQQLAYYRARAHEYDDWFYRKGRYDRGAPVNSRWFTETEIVRSALHEFCPCGDVLELAAGTGIWTEELARYANSVTAVDASHEVLEINRSKVGDGVEYVVADLFTWSPARLYDTVFFGFWLSHVPPSHFDVFWSLVRRCLKPSGRVFFVDSALESTSAAKDHEPPDPSTFVAKRKLDDGRDFQIVKVFYEPGELTGRLQGLGWNIDVRPTESYFIFGAGEPS